MLLSLYVSISHFSFSMDNGHVCNISHFSTSWWWCAFTLKFRLNPSFLSLYFHLIESWTWKFIQLVILLKIWIFTSFNSWRSLISLIPPNIILNPKYGVSNMLKKRLVTNCTQFEDSKIMVFPVCCNLDWELRVESRELRLFIQL